MDDIELFEKMKKNRTLIHTVEYTVRKQEWNLA